MWWLLDIVLFFRDFERDWGTPQARRKSLRGCLGVLGLFVFIAGIAFVVFAARSGR